MYLLYEEWHLRASMCLSCLTTVLSSWPLSLPVYQHGKPNSLPGCRRSLPYCCSFARLFSQHCFACRLTALTMLYLTGKCWLVKNKMQATRKTLFTELDHWDLKFLQRPQAKKIAFYLLKNAFSSLLCKGSLPGKCKGKWDVGSEYDSLPYIFFPGL